MRQKVEAQNKTAFEKFEEKSREIKVARKPRVVVIYKIKSKNYEDNRLIPLVPRKIRKMILPGLSYKEKVHNQYIFLTNFIHMNMYKVGVYLLSNYL